MSKEIDINNEEQILKECDFDYYYNSENCSRELCKFYNDICHEEDNKFAKTEAYVDLGRIGITLNKQAKQISDLEAKLAESDKTIDEINKEFLSAIKNWKQLVEIEKMEKEQLKQQLAEKENTIEFYETYLKAKDEVREESKKWYEKQLAEKDKAHMEAMQNALNDFLTLRQELNEDKISFAVEQLEKVKEYADIDFRKNCYINAVELDKFINNQIEELKKEMK